MAFLADLHGRQSHQLVSQALVALRNLVHRGAAGAESSSGDGAGITLQVPDGLLREVVDFPLPAPGAYAVGTAFLPVDPDAAERIVTLIEDVARAEGLRVLGWRDVPTDPSGVGPTALSVMPAFRQLFLAGPDGLGASSWNGSSSASARWPSGVPGSGGRSCTSRRCRPERWSTRGC